MRPVGSICALIFLKSIKLHPLTSDITIDMKIYTFLFVTVSCLVSCSPNKETQTPPNIIYILADDLGYGDVGAYGQQLIQTPNIDALASTGMLFTQHYSGSPVCAPSRYMLLTGKHPGHAHIRGNDEWASRGDVWNYAAAVEDPNLEGQRPIPNETLTLGEMLQSNGYKTAIVGKWGLGAPLTDGIPNKQGFDFFYGYNCQRQAHNLYPKHLWKNQEKDWLDNELIAPGTNLPEGADSLDIDSYSSFFQPDYAPEKMQKEVIGFIEANKDQPFFLYYASPIPHLPLQVPMDSLMKYEEIFGDEAPYAGNRGYFPNRYPRAAYAAMVSYLDSQVGEIVVCLKELGIYDNTLIIFTSDNGPTYDVGGFDPYYFSSAAPFQDGRGRTKGNTYEGGIRVPMIASWPGHIEPGSTNDVISAFWDVMPTFSDIVGNKNSFDTDGISFLPSMTGIQEDQVEHEFLYWEFPSYGGQQAVRMGDWKGIRRNIFKGNMDIELYNLASDIREEYDVAMANPEVVAKIREIMKNEHTPATIERFKMEALGDPMAANNE